MTPADKSAETKALQWSLSEAKVHAKAAAMHLHNLQDSDALFRLNKAVFVLKSIHEQYKGEPK